MRIMLAYLESFVDMSGGIERVCCNMANEFCARGNDVAIVYCGQCDKQPFYPLDEHVQLYNLMNLQPSKWKGRSFQQCVSGGNKLIREVIRMFNANKARDWNEKVKGMMIVSDIEHAVSDLKPDIIVSFRYETSNYLINYAHVDKPVVTMFHTDPAVILPVSPKGEIAAVQKSTEVQVLLKKDVAIVEKYCPGAKVCWIPNGVPQYEKQVDLKNKKSGKYTIINVARLDKWPKRQYLIVEAFAEIAKQFPEWQVELWGGGHGKKREYEKELHSLICKYHLENQVFLKGESRCIIEHYLSSDIFCFPSAYEGFPLAMTEAMSAGLPVVAYKSCDAVSELVEDGKDGLLAEDGVLPLATALQKLMSNQAMRIEMGINARRKMIQFSPSKIWDQWEELMRRTVREYHE